MAKVKDLKPHRLNPRKMSDSKKESLKRSIEAFGDLGAIVFNTRSGNLVSGHQRSSVLNKDNKIVIEKKYDSPTPQGTVAVGYIEVGEDRISYREVDWDTTKETEAMIAANKHSGEWDNENLRILFADLPFFDVELTGFTENELRLLDIEIPEINQELLAINNTLGEEEEDEESDEQYVRNQDESGEVVHRQVIGGSSIKDKYREPDPEPSEVREFEGKTLENKIIVLAIKCSSEEQKKELREKIKPLLEGTDAVLA